MIPHCNLPTWELRKSHKREPSRKLDQLNLHNPAMWSGAACIIECYVKMTKGGGCGRVESRKSACDRENCRFEIDLLLIPFVNFLSLSLIHSSSFTADGVFSSRSASSTDSTSSPASYSTSRRYPGSSTPAASSRNLSSVSECRFT